jgi:hypothetical protein
MNWIWDCPDSCETCVNLDHSGGKVSVVGPVPAALSAGAPPPVAPTGGYSKLAPLNRGMASEKERLPKTPAPADDRAVEDFSSDAYSKRALRGEN